MKFKLLCAIVFGLLMDASAAIATTEFVYVPQLTGSYNIGDIAETSYNDGFESFGLKPATYRESGIYFSWNGNSPRYLTYEISGILTEPVALNEYENPSEINFNGAFIFSPRPGIGWGTTLNTNSAPNGLGHFQTEKRYDPVTGGFYFGAIIDVVSAYTDPCCSAWGSSSVSNLNASVHAIFYNYPPLALGVAVEYLERGSVFIESARVGLTTDFQLPSTSPMNRILVAPVPEPETYAMLLTGLGLMGVVARRRKNTQL